MVATINGTLPLSSATGGDADAATVGGVDERYIGVALALSSTVFNGTSFVLKKKGLIASDTDASAFACLYNPIWWAGTVLMGLGEAANFAAYSFAPAILVTPLGALSVVISAVLAAIFLNERMDRAGKIGCGLCMIGSVIIVMHAPPERELASVNDVINYMVQPHFVAYLSLTLAYLVFAYYHLGPKYGRRNMLVYISMCSLGGSVLVIACKGLGIALRLTFQGNNQLVYPSFYFFLLLVIVCVIFQLNYLNRALDNFPAGAVSPVYYVFFTVATIVATLILFQGTEATSLSQALSVLFGFAVMVFGVFLLHSPAVMTAASHVGDAINSMELDMELVRVDDDDKTSLLELPGSRGPLASLS